MDTRFRPRYSDRTASSASDRSVKYLIRTIVPGLEARDRVVALLLEDYPAPLAATVVVEPGRHAVARIAELLRSSRAARTVGACLAAITRRPARAIAAFERSSPEGPLDAGSAAERF
jgi:hypothetical protein